MTDKEINMIQELIKTGNELAEAKFEFLAEKYNSWRLRLTFLLSDLGLSECGADLSYASEFPSLRRMLSVIAEHAEVTCPEVKMGGRSGCE